MLASQASPPAPVPEGALATLAQLVEARSGLRFLESRRTELAMKASRAFASSGQPTWDAYLHRLSGGGDLLDALIAALTVGETYVFRHRAAFEVLEQTVLPDLIARRAAARSLRLWSAGCATGEEAYSIAIAVRRTLPDLQQWDVRILATDINPAFLARAAEGVYGEWSFRETDDRFKASYFTTEGKRYRIRPEIRRLVRFAPLNLAEDGYPSSATNTAHVDLIVCRNVLIYFGPERSYEMVQRLRASLAPGGWLMLGPSDALPGLLDGFEMQLTPPGVFYRRLEASAERRAPGGTLTRADTGSAATIAHAVRPLPAAPPWPAPVARTPLEAPAPPKERAHEAAGDVAWQAARASADAGLLEEAEDHCRRAAAHDTLRPEPYHLLGMLRQARGDDAGALAAFRQALYADRSFALALLAVAALKRRTGNVAEARHALARAERLLAGRPADELVLADAGLTVGRLRDAVAQVRALDQGRSGE